jgi:hypothetical protein
MVYCRILILTRETTKWRYKRREKGKRERRSRAEITKQERTERRRKSKRELRYFSLKCGLQVRTLENLKAWELFEKQTAHKNVCPRAKK